MKFPSWIPEYVRVQLDPEDFVSYESAVASDADAFAARFDVFVATYAARPPTEGFFKHLCRTFEAAPLAPQAIEELRRVEQRHREVTFVAYAKPLRRRT